MKLAERSPDQDLDLVQVQRLQQVVDCPSLEASHRALDGAEGGHDDHANLRVRRLDLLQQCPAVQDGHPQVGDHELDLSDPQHLQGLGAVAGLKHFGPEVTKQALELLSLRGVVIDDEETRAECHVQDPVLQELYDELVVQGRESLVEALNVGATIEDLDLSDLVGMIERTDTDDLALVYHDLMKGTRNHLRAFAGLLAANGIDYEAQLISVDLLEEILSTPKERGPVDAQGEPTTCQEAGAPGGPRRGDYPDMRPRQGRRS